MGVWHTPFVLHITQLLYNFESFVTPLWLWQACWNENCGSSPRGLWHDQNFGRPGQNLELLDVQSPSKNPKQIMKFLTLSSSSYCDMWHVPYFDTSPAGTHCDMWQLNHLEIVQYVDSYCEKKISIFQMRLVCITGNWPVHLRWVVPNTGQSIYDGELLTGSEAGQSIWGGQCPTLASPFKMESAWNWPA
jgi:hypothetical protein